MSLKQKRMVDPVLTELSTGFAAQGTIGTEIFQVVESTKEGGIIPVFGKSAFRDYNTKRAIRAASNRRNPDGRDELKFLMEEHDIEAAVDYREQDESVFDEEQEEARNNKTILTLGLERTIAGIVTNPLNYAGGNSEVLSGTDQWTDPTSRPDIQVKDAVETVRKKIGWRPRKMWISAEAYAALQVHDGIRALLKSDALKIPSLDDLRQLFQMEKILIGDPMTANDDDTFSDIWGNGFGLFAQMPAKNMKTPNFGYTVMKKGRKGDFSDTYTEGGGKIKIVRSTKIYDVFQTSQEAAFLYTNAV